MSTLLSQLTPADDVLALVKQRAAAEGVPEDEIATEAIWIGLRKADGAC